LGNASPPFQRIGLLDLAQDFFTADLRVDDGIGMGLADVDQEELGGVLVGLIEPL